MSMDEDGDDEMELKDAQDAAADDSVPMPAPDATGMDKENEGDLPVVRNKQAEARKARVAALQQTADSMFPEGHGKAKAATKTGAAAELINELVVDAKEAVDALWKARGYLKMKPKQRKMKLGYALDREEALG